MSLARVVVALFCLFLCDHFFLCDHLAFAQGNYKVTFINDDESIEGYSKIQISENGSVSGRICAFEDFNPYTGKVRRPLGIIDISGLKKKDEMTLAFTSTNRDAFVEKFLPKDPMTFTAGSGTSFGDVLPQTDDAWDASSDTKRANIRLLPDKFTPSEDHSSARIDDRRKVRLSIFDGMSPSNAFRYMTKVKWDELIESGVVVVAYDPKNRSALSEFLSKLNAKAHLVDPAIPDCGVNYIQDIIRVPPLLEFYIARQVQKSGLVLDAFPVPIPRAPPFAVLSIRSPALTGRIQKADLAQDQLTDEFASFFERELRAFLVAKRPRFPKERFELIPQNAGMPFAYKVQVTGPAISECNRRTWEQFEVQIVLTSFNGLAVFLQAPSGFFAPGSLNDRPTDARFKENVLDDLRLSKIQDQFKDFLTRRGIARDSDDNRPGPPISPCRL